MFSERPSNVAMADRRRDEATPKQATPALQPPAGCRSVTRS